MTYSQAFNFRGQIKCIYSNSDLVSNLVSTLAAAVLAVSSMDNGSLDPSLQLSVQLSWKLTDWLTGWLTEQWVWVTWVTLTDRDWVSEWVSSVTLTVTLTLTSDWLSHWHWQVRHCFTLAFSSRLRQKAFKIRGILFVIDQEMLDGNLKPTSVDSVIWNASEESKSTTNRRKPWTSFSTWWTSNSVDR